MEVGGKIGQGGITVGHYHRGFHGTGTLAIFPLWRRWPNGTISMWRHADGIRHRRLDGERAAAQLRHHDQAAAYGLGGAQAAGRRESGPQRLHRGPGHPGSSAGFFAAYGVEASRPESAIDGLGNPWVIVDPGLALKRFPCCYASHRGMDGVLQLRQRLGLTAENLEHLECRMPPGGMRVLIYPQPKTGLEGKFSLQYALAAGVLDGEYTLWSFTDEAVNRPQIRDLLARIDVERRPRCAGNDPLLETRSSGSRGFVEVEAVRTDGRRETVRVDQAPGHPARELTWDDIAAKFMDCAAQARIDPNKAEQASRHLDVLGNLHGHQGGHGTAALRSCRRMIGPPSALHVRGVCQ